MKVKELIEELSRYNPNAEVECTYSNDTFNINEIVDETFATFYPTVLIDDAVVKDLEKLKEYEDLEEQGKLVKLPIEDKKGDCRECVHTKTQCHHMEYKCSECPLTELFCDEFYLAIDRCYEDAYASGCLAGMDLAKSEAEAKLKELKGDINGK